MYYPLKALAFNRMIYIYHIYNFYIFGDSVQWGLVAELLELESR